MSCESCRLSECGPFTLEPAPLTKDGKRTWRPICAGGLAGGGCKPPTLGQIEVINKEVGIQLGAEERTPPLWLEQVLGQVSPITHSWRRPLLRG